MSKKIKVTSREAFLKSKKTPDYDLDYKYLKLTELVEGVPDIWDYVYYIEQENLSLRSRIREMKAHDITTPEILKQFGDLSAKLMGTVERAKKVTEKLSEMQPKPKKEGK